MPHLGCQRRHRYPSGRQNLLCHLVIQTLPRLGLALKCQAILGGSIWDSRHRWCRQGPIHESPQWTLGPFCQFLALISSWVRCCLSSFSENVLWRTTSWSSLSLIKKSVALWLHGNLYLCAASASVYLYPLCPESQVTGDSAFWSGESISFSVQSGSEIQFFLFNSYVPMFR